MPDSTSGGVPPVRYYPYRVSTQYWSAWGGLLTWSAAGLLFGVLFSLGGGPGVGTIYLFLSPLLLVAAGSGVAMTLQARYVYVELSERGLIRQNWRGKQTLVERSQVQEIIWRLQLTGYAPLWNWHRASLLELLYTAPDGRHTKMGIAGGYAAEGTAAHIRDEIVQRLGFSPLPPRGARQVWARPGGTLPSE